ncbi:MAG: Uma2 family endonuclease [Gemmataceae bacterium]|nr:Uma2 family endonuclease [Planctomycetia bacterium]MBX3397888.1 Uma2 family endonuclease [Gemmataceae bacterium]
MSALLMPSPVSTPPPKFVPKPIRWTCQQFQDMSDSGVLEGRTVILVDGEILDMPKPNPPHDTAVTLTLYVLLRVFAQDHFVRVQTGLPTNLDTDPIPDLAVIAGSPRDFSKQHPSTASLVVEVADSSLDYDLGTKSNLYAAAGILDYWVIDVNGQQLHVFRDPVADATAPRGFRYNSIQVLDHADTITPLAGSVPIAVADLLP